MSVGVVCLYLGYEAIDRCLASKAPKNADRVQMWGVLIVSGQATTLFSECVAAHSAQLGGAVSRVVLSSRSYQGGRTPRLHAYGHNPYD